MDALFIINAKETLIYKNQICNQDKKKLLYYDENNLLFIKDEKFQMLNINNYYNYNYNHYNYNNYN